MKTSLDRILLIFRIKAVLTVLRFAASLAAGFALPFALAEMQRPYPGGGQMLWLAVSAVFVQILCNVMLFWVEYNPLYNLSPNLGLSIGQAFEADILGFKAQFTTPASEIRSAQEQDREAWEYTARAFLHKYRFDSSLGANRFGSIMHYIMCGSIKTCFRDQKTAANKSCNGFCFEEDESNEDNDDHDDQSCSYYLEN